MVWFAIPNAAAANVVSTVLVAVTVGVPGVTVPKWRIIVLLTRVRGLVAGGVGVLGLR